LVDFSTGSRLKVILAAVPLESDHTAEHLSLVLTEEVLQKWEIPAEKVHSMVHDNARNMVKAVELAGVFVDVRCFAHTIQLVIASGIKEPRMVNYLLTKLHGIVRHFIDPSKLTDVSISSSKIITLQSIVSSRTL